MTNFTGKSKDDQQSDNDNRTTTIAARQTLPDTNLRVMEANLINPVIIPAHAAVLLCFMPDVSVRQQAAEHPTLNAVMSQLQKRLPPSVRMLRIDEAAHPEVVKSFNVIELPAFVLVRQGVEQWRREGVKAVRDVASMPDFAQESPPVTNRDLSGI